jgi:hypothetical protein
MSEDSGSPMSLPTSDQVLSALDRTGFILEYRVAQALQKFHCITILNNTYVDPESGKTREMDVLATFFRNVVGVENRPKVLISAELVIECKNYVDPIVVIGESAEIRYHNDQPAISFDPLQFEFANRDPHSHGRIRMALGLGGLDSHSTVGFIGSQLVKMRRQGGNWQATNDSIHDSIIYPLAKASEYERTQTANWDHDEEAPWDIPHFAYQFPVFITAGRIFAVDVVPDQTPTVRLAKWVPLVRNLDDDNSSFMMDVVSYDFLEEYMEERVLTTISDAHRVISEHLEYFDPHWLQQHYGESSDSTFLAWLQAT